jgi:RHS repeat-associated protein
MDLSEIKHENDTGNKFGKVHCVGTEPENAPAILTIASPENWSYLPVGQAFDVRGVARSLCSNWPSMDIEAALYCDSVSWNLGFGGPFNLSFMAPDTESVCELIVFARTAVQRRTLVFLNDVEQRPHVELTAPTSGNLIWPDQLQFSANAVGASGHNISRVEFVDRSSVYENGSRLLGMDVTSPYALPAQTLLPGSHSIQAIAIDSGGYRALSTPVSIVSAPNQRATLRLTHPVAGSSVPFGTAIDIRLDTSDSDGYVAEVEFFSDSKTSLGTLTRNGPSSDPFVFSWLPPSAKSYQIYAIATDNRDLTKSVGPLSLNVTNAAPILTLSQPIDGLFVEHPTPVALSVSVVDDQAVSHVTYVISAAQSSRDCNGTTLTATAAQGFATTWTPPCGGRYRVQASAIDTLGVTGQTTINDVFVTKVGTNVEPFTRLIAPTSGQHFKPGMILNLSAQVRDDGSTASTPGIASVNFHMDGVVIKTITTHQSYNPTTRISVWTTTYTIPAGTLVGLHQITANAQESAFSPLSWGISPQVPINVVTQLPTSATLSLPGGATTLTMPTSTTLTATMANPEGTLVRNEFYLNDVLVASSTPPQTQVIWTPTASANDSWRMRVQDNVGVWTEARLDVTVLPNPAHPLPTVSWANLVSGQMIDRTSGTVPIEVVASAQNGPIQYVDLYDGIQKIGRATAFGTNFLFNWLAPTEGAHSLTARAVGPTGVAAVTSPINVFITSASPQIAIVAPTPNATGFVAPENIWVSVNASDDVRVTELRYYLDATAIPVATVLPPSPGAAVPLDYLYEGLTQGNHTLRARAYDGGGNFSDATVDVNIVANVLPTAGIPTAVTAAPYYEARVVTFDTVVSDPDENAVQSVEFLNIAGNVIAVAQLRLAGPTPTYRSSWTLPLGAGSYSFRARVTDRHGGIGLSAPQSITILVAAAPQVSFATPSLPGAGNAVFVGEPVHLSAQVSDPDVGGQITLVEFRRHFALNGQPTSEVIYSSSNGGNATYTYNWIVPPSAVGQTSTFSVTAQDNGPPERNTTTVSSSTQIAVLLENHSPRNVRFHPFAIGTSDSWPGFWGDWQLLPAMPSMSGWPGTFDYVPAYKVQSNGRMLLCAFAEDEDGNLGGMRFHLTRPNVPDVLLTEVTSKTNSGFCAGGYKADVDLSSTHERNGVQFIRAQAFDSRNAAVATQVNPDSGQSGHIPCVGDPFRFGSNTEVGSPCVKFSIPVAIVNPLSATSPCGNPGSSTICDANSRFVLATPGVDKTLQAERYDSGGHGVGMFEKDYTGLSSIRGDESRIHCTNPSTFGPHCTLKGFDNGEYRRYSVTMPAQGTVDYTIRFKPPLPTVWVKHPQEDAHFTIDGTGAFQEVLVWADVSGHLIGDGSDSTVYVKFFRQFDGPDAQLVEFGRTGPSDDRTHFGGFRPGVAGTWKLSAQAVVTFYPPSPELPYEIEGPLSEVRRVHWATSWPAGTVISEPSLPPIAATETEPVKDLGFFEGRTNDPGCTDTFTALEDRAERWFTEKFCGIGLPANDYYFNLRSDVDGTEVDWIRFSYVSGSVATPIVEVGAPEAESRFPVGAAVGLQGNFSGSTSQSLLRFEIWPIDEMGQPAGSVQVVESNHYPDFNAIWVAPNPPGRYMVRAKGQLTASGASFTSVGVRFHVDGNAQNSAPQVTLTSPAANLSWQLGTPLSLAMTATDPDGINPATVRFVLVHDGGNGAVLIGDANAQGYSVSWTPLATGTYHLSAYATDSLGNMGSWTGPRIITVTGTSGTPTVNISASPSVGLIAPASTELRALVSGGSNISVQFEHSSGAEICSGVPEQGNAYTCVWEDLPAGSYSVRARASVDGQTYLSTTINLIVSDPQPVAATRTYVYDEHQRLCKVINPESGATFFGYDAAGNLEWTLEGSNLTGDVCDRAAVQSSPLRVMRSYDEMNRLKRIDYPAGTDDVRYDYELDGALKTVEVLGPGDALRNKWSYAYNNRRLPISETLLLDGQSRKVGYSYNPNGHLEALTYPGPGDGRKVEYAPNALGQPTQVADAAGTLPIRNIYASDINYYPNGAIANFNYGNGIHHEMTQNERYLPTQSLSTRDGVALIDDRYHYDGNGNVTEILDHVTPTFTRSMDYDDLDRLTHTSVGAAFWNSSDYTYDALDNIRSAKQGTRNFRYDYTSQQRLRQMYDPMGADLIDLTYNPVGDVISKHSVKTGVVTDHAYVYDTAHRLLSVTTVPNAANVASYEYDGHGRRVKEIRPAQLDEVGFYNQAGQKLYTKQGSTETFNIYFGGSLLAELKSGAPYTLTYLHTDALGSVVAKSDVDGEIQQRYRYTPYGEDFGGTLNGLGYTGHDMDQETGLTYMQQRYYDPVIGRFLAIDPVAADGDTGGNFNRYWYARNNPYRNIDPDGRNAISPWDWYDFAVDVGSVIVNEMVYGAAVALGDDEVAQIALDKMSEGVIDASMSTAGLISPVPGTGKVMKAGKAVSNAVEAGAKNSDEAAAAVTQTTKKAKEYGSYTNTHESGKTYNGSGDRKRSQTSGKERAAANNDPHTATDWTRSNSKREGMKDESRRIDADGGVSSPSNYNKIESPGKKYREEDGE